jgi:hypothetical protein
MKSFRIKFARGALIAAAAMMTALITHCGSKSGSGNRDVQPDFGARESIFSPGRGSVEFLETCFNLPSGEIAEFVGWMAAQVKLEKLATVCRGLSAAEFNKGVSTTKDPVDIE